MCRSSTRDFKVIVHVWRVGKKEKVDMKVTTNKSTGFYVKSAKSFFAGTEDKEPHAARRMRLLVLHVGCYRVKVLLASVEARQLIA